MRSTTALLVAVSLTASAHASSNGVIIQAWIPNEAAGLDWAPEGVDTLDELWNDCAIVYGEFFNRQTIGQDTNKVHLLWGKGTDFRRPHDDRYSPTWLGIAHQITDDSATAATVENTFKTLGGTMGANDSLFVYTWGHGVHDGPTGQPTKATHYGLTVRPASFDDGKWSLEPLWDHDFAQMTDTVHANRLFIMQQCYGGGFMDDLADSVTSLYCATAAGKDAQSADNQGGKNGSPTPEHELYQGDTWRHVEFSFHFFNALRDGHAVAPYGNPDTYPTRPDLNHDSTVSWSEAFAFNERYNSISRTIELPVCFEANVFWKDIAQMPGPKKTGLGTALTAIESPDTTSLLYAFKGNKSVEFYSYDPLRDSWAELESIPRGSKPVRDGSTLAGSSSGFVYATKGNCTQFWRYCVSPDSNPHWRQLADVPWGWPHKKVGPGASSVCDRYDSSTDLVYLLKGNKTRQFLRYDSNADQWDSLPSPPVGTNYPSRKYTTGSCLTSDGLGHLYLLRGTTPEFYRYDTASRAWSTNRAWLPPYGRAGKKKPPKQGAGLAYFFGKVYAQKGNNSNELWVHDCSGNSWAQARDVDSGMSGKTVGKGGAIVRADNYLWFLKGKSRFDFLRFSPNRVLTAPGQDNSPAPGGDELLIAEGQSCADPRMSWGGDRIAFTKTGTGEHAQLFVASCTGGDATEITDLDGNCRDPVWLPDPQDEKIALVYEPEDSCSQLAVVSSQGGQVTRLVKDLGDIGSITWSSDGQSLVFDCDSGGWVQLWQYSFADSSVKVLTTSAADHCSPVYASATEIVFTLDDPDGLCQIGKLYQYAPDTAEPENLVWRETTLTTSAYDHASPSVAAASGHVFFEVDNSSGYTMVGWVTLDGDSETVITSGNYDFECPTPTYSGDTLFCLRSEDGGAAICKVSSDGSGYTDVTDDEVERESPHTRMTDGSSASAAYIRDGSVYRIRGPGERGQQGGVLGTLVLEQLRPNPARRRVSLRWQVPVLSQASLKVYNTAGQLVKVLAQGEHKRGRYVSVWDGSDRRGRQVATGVYFVALESGKTRLNRKVILTGTE